MQATAVSAEMQQAGTNAGFKSEMSEIDKMG